MKMKDDFHEKFIETAMLFGAAAYISDLDRKPARDNLLLILLEDLDIDETESILHAWLNGYDCAKNQKISIFNNKRSSL